jgi:hypothetical protein
MSIIDSRIILYSMQRVPRNRIEQGHLRVNSPNFAASRERNPVSRRRARHRPADIREIQVEFSLASVTSGAMAGGPARTLRLY